MKKKTSLKTQLIFTLIILVAGTVFLCWLLNNTFLEKYYSYNKQVELMKNYDMINAAENDGTLTSDSVEIQLEKNCMRKNINIMVIGENREVVFAISPNEQQFKIQFTELLFGSNRVHEQTMVSTDAYSIEKQVDKRTNTEYLVLLGTLDNGDYIYMRTALESIKESVAISNKFLFYIAICAVLVCVVVIFVLSNSISRPIKELTDLSKQMSNLDFEAHYEAKKFSSMEIEQLGTHMNELSDTLQQTIAELKSANNELQKDIAQKEQVDEIRKEFLSNVSHELKTPLALISGYAEGLKEVVNDDPESRDFYCEVIMDETEKMNQMVKKLLTLNQLEFGNEVVEMQRFDLTDLINGVINANSLMAVSLGIQLEFMENQPRFVWGDEFKVEEVITNYLSNAIHYAAGDKKITIFFEQKGNVLRTCVKNTGDPIPQEELDKVWIKFYKVDKARTREYGGSGIGLSIVKAIMDSFHQKCGVYNEGDGVVFWMELECGSNL